ncbi:metallopeptidase TldD-related protein [Streptomyces sp. NPDC054834]
MSLASANEPNVERLLELAEWALGELRAAADYVQVFAESTLHVRVECVDGDILATGVEPRDGLGCLVSKDGVWRFKAVAPSQIPVLVSWLGASGHARTPLWPSRATAAGFTPFDASAWLVPEQPESGGTSSIRSVEDFVCRSIAVADTAGVRSATTTRTLRQRVEVTLTVDGRRYRGLSRWLKNGTEERTHPGAHAITRVALGHARNSAAATVSGKRRTPVVFGPAAAAGFLHELVGHALEADNFALGSDYITRLRKPGALPAGLTLLDDATVPHGYGSYTIDDEGRAAGVTTLLENGEIGTPVTSLRAAQRGGYPPTANGRRQSYQFLAVPRATNTVAFSGAEDPGLLGEDPRTGVLHVGCLGAGMINLSTGESSFAALNCSYATPTGDRVPLRDVSLLGDALDTLSRLEGIGSDFGGDNITCGKQGQSVGIGIYSPSMRYAALDWSAG